MGVGVLPERRARGRIHDDPPMSLITDKQRREDIVERLRKSSITLEELGKQLGLSKERISQILRSEKPLPMGFYARAERAMQAIQAERCKVVGLPVCWPDDSEPPAE